MTSSSPVYDEQLVSILTTEQEQYSSQKWVELFFIGCLKAIKYGVS